MNPEGPYFLASRFRLRAVHHVGSAMIGLFVAMGLFHLLPVMLHAEVVPSVPVEPLRPAGDSTSLAPPPELGEWSPEPDLVQREEGTAEPDLEPRLEQVDPVGEGHQIAIRTRPVALVPDRRPDGLPKGRLDQVARPTHRVAPVYPADIRKQKIEGRVILAVEVKSDGSVGRIAVRQGSGTKALDQAAIKALRKWKFVPASRDGRKVNSTVLQPVKFALR